MLIPESCSEVELTILMPCLNEAETIGICITKANAFLTRTAISGEILVADNGSTDGSQAIAKELGARVVSIPKRGYGAALIGGIEAALGRYVIMADADDSYDFTSLDSIVGDLRNGSDLVMGNRFGGIEPGAMPLLHRYLGNPVLSFIGRLLFSIKIGDFHCGLRGFKTTSIRSLGLRAVGMEFASEMVVRSALQGLSISEVPTTLRPDGRSRPPHLRTWLDGWRHLKFLLMYSPRWLYLIPGAILTTVGTLLAGILIFGPINFGSIELDINTLLVASFFVVAGTQLLTFGALSRYYAAMTGILPTTERARTVLDWITTDRLLQIAFGIFLLGSLGFGYAVGSWAEVGFGPLNNKLVPRLLIFGLTGMLVGTQTAFAAFLFGVFEIPIRKE